MLTVIGAYPSKENERDGMIRRIQKIDGVFHGIKRQYLEISLKKYIKPHKYVKNDVTVYQLNFFFFLFMIIYFCIKSQVIYVHSIYNALYVLPMYFFKKTIITDMHGVVIEEIKMNKKHGKAYISLGILVYGIVERIVAKQSCLIISVTHNMKAYFSQKYHIAENREIVIPIFDEIAGGQKIYHSKRLHAIYSGGIQPWQCIDQLIQFIYKTADHLEWTVLSPDAEFFKAKLSKFMNYQNITIKSVAPTEVKKYYQKADLGIVLREDNIVNRVACPTKLIEYLQYSLIPVVLSPQIGDFYQQGYCYLPYEKLYKSNESIGSLDLQQMNDVNMKIIHNLSKETQKKLSYLKKFVQSKL